MPSILTLIFCKCEITNFSEPSGHAVLSDVAVVVSDSFATQRTVAPPAASVHGISQQEYWSGLPFPSPGDLPNLGMEPRSPALAGELFTTEPPGKPLEKVTSHFPGGLACLGRMRWRIQAWPLASVKWLLLGYEEIIRTEPFCPLNSSSPFPPPTPSPW